MLKISFTHGPDSDTFTSLATSLTKSSAPTERKLNQAAKRSQTTKPPKLEPLTSANYFPALQQLMYNVRHDKRLTPLTQLVYRVLSDLANRNYWAQPFLVTDSELQDLTRINSRETLTRIKQQLKNLGYIDFYGKPSHLTVYSPPVYKSVQKSV